MTVVTFPAGAYARCMNLPSRVIYLPPGVVPPPATAVHRSAPTVPGFPFDRVFFEQILPPAIGEFCRQVGCEIPVVEVSTVDGATHYVNGISGVSDQWVALSTARPDHPHQAQIFVPFQTIFRVEIHPESDEKRAHLGFVTNPPRIPEVIPPLAAPSKAKAPARRPAAGKSQ